MKNNKNILYELKTPTATKHLWVAGRDSGQRRSPSVHRPHLVGFGNTDEFYRVIQSMGLEHILVGNHLFSQNTVRFRHVWQGIIQIGNTNAFMIISR